MMNRLGDKMRVSRVLCMGGFLLATGLSTLEAGKWGCWTAGFDVMGGVKSSDNELRMNLDTPDGDEISSVQVGNLAGVFGLRLAAGLVVSKRVSLMPYGEVFWAWDDKKTSTVDTVSLSYSTESFQWGTGLNIGYMFGAAMPYVRLGARWKCLNANGSENQSEATGYKTYVAFTPGVGLAWELHQYVAVGIEWTADIYGEKKHTSETDDGSTRTLKVQPYDYQALAYLRIKI